MYYAIFFILILIPAYDKSIITIVSSIPFNEQRSFCPTNQFRVVLEFRSYNLILVLTLGCVSLLVYVLKFVQI